MPGLIIDYTRGRLRPGQYTIISNFIDHVRNRTPLLVSVEDGKDVVRILEEITKQIEVKT